MNLRLAWTGLLLVTGLVASETAEPFAFPAPERTNEPNLHTGPDGTVYLTYSGPGVAEGERALWLARLAPGSSTWSAPAPIVSTPRLMENWADFASLVVATDGSLWAQWFERPADPQELGYSGRVARSTDGGATWSVSTQLGHEFVSLAPLPGGRVLAVWLASTRPPRRAGDPPPAPRPPGPAAPSMQLRACLLAANGESIQDWIVDPDVCNCCQTSVAVRPGGRISVVYRGRTPAEIRDHRIAHFDGRSWSRPESLHDDGWQISACPVNGPALAACDDRLSVVWFTAANGKPRVQSKRHERSGERWTPPQSVDLGRPLGRIDLVALADGSAILSWLEAGDAANEADLYVRRQSVDGTLSAPVRIATSHSARASGFARLAALRDGTNDTLVAWTEVLADAIQGQRALTRIRTARIAADRFSPNGVRLGASSAPRGPVVLELCDPRLVAADH